MANQNAPVDEILAKKGSKSIDINGFKQKFQKVTINNNDA